MASAKPGLFCFRQNHEARLDFAENKKSPLHCREDLIVGVAGFEPATSWSQTRRDDRATLHPEKNSGETGTRTLATFARRQISNLLRYHSGTSPVFIRTLIR
jgi:hypothetical protein